MRITRDQILEAIQEYGAGGSPAAVVDVVWGQLNLPQDENLYKVCGELKDAGKFSSKGIEVTIIFANTTTNFAAIEAMKGSGCEVAILSQETELEDHPNQGELDLNGEEAGDEAPEPADIEA